VHEADFVQKQGQMVVTEVRLEAFGGATATYTFTYAEVELPRACNHPRFCFGGDGFCGDRSNVDVPLLTNVELPDGSAYAMPVTSYRTGSTATCPSEERQVNGLLERLDLPVGGAYEWDWATFRFPELSGHRFGAPVGAAADPPVSKSVGIAERRHLNRSGGVLGRWTYEHALTAFGDNFGQRELVVSETAEPPGHVTKHYFSVWPGDPDPTEEEDVPPGG
jgi:hypothetical protein